MTQPYNGLGLNLGNLSRLSNAETRSISAENPTGAKGQGGRHVDPNHEVSRDLGTGWKVRPCVGIPPGETLVLADVDGAQFVVANHHGSNGVLSLFSGRGEHLWSIQPTFHVEEPVALAWPGAEADLLWVHTLDSRQAFYDGFGRCVKRFPHIEAVIGEHPHRDLNAQAVRFGNGARHPRLRRAGGPGG